MTPSAPPPRHYPALDGLRGICAALVVVAHCGANPLAGPASGRARWLAVEDLGRVGVDVFFALSGFLIAGLLLDERAATGRIDLGRFYARRTLRIWPNYYVALTLGFGAAALRPGWWGRTFGGLTGGPLVATRLPRFAAFLGNWAADGVALPLRLLWSVCIEEQFYVVFPLALALGRGRHPAFPVVALGLLGAHVTRATLAPGRDPYFHTLAHADHLLWGVLLAQALRRWPGPTRAAFRRLAAPLEAGAVLGLGLLWWHRPAWEARPGGVLATYPAGGLLTATLVGVLALGDGPLSRLCSRGALRRLGGLTYAAYCFHAYPVALGWKVAGRLPWGAWGQYGVRVLVAVPASFLVAWACGRTYEGWFLRLKDRRRARGTDRPGVTRG